MDTPQLSSLEEVNVRQAWAHEAHVFTPWLAEHLDLLAKELGIQLEFEGQEVAVGRFSADILARNPLDDSIVLIENQLEVTDHSHLGQIMTYLAGLNAQTIIWIATDFREAHLSAIQWLNEHTVEPFSFFAVKVKVVRIDDSPLAPIFEVLLKPNLWERQLQAVAQETQSLTKRGEFRRAFWSHYVDRYPDELRHGSLGASARWHSLPDLDLVVSCFLAKENVGVFIRGLRGSDERDVYERLALYVAELTKELEAEIDEKRGYHFMKRYPADTSDRACWDELADWIYKTSHQYAEVLSTIMRV